LKKVQAQIQHPVLHNSYCQSVREREVSILLPPSLSRSHKNALDTGLKPVQPGSNMRLSASLSAIQ